MDQNSSGKIGTGGTENNEKPVGSRETLNRCKGLEADLVHMKRRCEELVEIRNENKQVENQNGVETKNRVIKNGGSKAESESGQIERLTSELDFVNNLVDELTLQLSKFSLQKSASLPFRYYIVSVDGRHHKKMQDLESRNANLIKEINQRDKAIEDLQAAVSELTEFSKEKQKGATEMQSEIDYERERAVESRNAYLIHEINQRDKEIEDLQAAVSELTELSKEKQKGATEMQSEIDYERERAVESRIANLIHEINQRDKEIEDLQAAISEQTELSEEKQKAALEMQSKIDYEKERAVDAEIDLIEYRREHYRTKCTEFVADAQEKAFYCQMIIDTLAAEKKKGQADGERTKLLIDNYQLAFIDWCEMKERVLSEKDHYLQLFGKQIAELNNGVELADIKPVKPPLLPNHPIVQEPNIESISITPKDRSESTQIAASTAQNPLRIPAVINPNPSSDTTTTTTTTTTTSTVATSTTSAKSSKMSSTNRLYVEVQKLLNRPDLTKEEILRTATALRNKDNENGTGGFNFISMNVKKAAEVVAEAIRNMDDSKNVVNLPSHNVSQTEPTQFSEKCPATVSSRGGRGSWDTGAHNADNPTRDDACAICLESLTAAGDEKNVDQMRECQHCDYVSLWLHQEMVQSGEKLPQMPKYD